MAHWSKADLGSLWEWWDPDWLIVEDEDEARECLGALEKIWLSSANYAAVFDALTVCDASTEGPPRWVTAATKAVLVRPDVLTAWKAAHIEDICDSFRAMAFIEFRFDEGGLSVVRPVAEAGELAVARLAGSAAHTQSPRALQDRLREMRQNEVQTPGRYYLGGCSYAIARSLGLLDRRAA